MPRPARARGAAVEQAILHATLKLLREDGYTALTIDRVAAVARASKTSIYRRWKNKEHLVLALFQQLPVPVPDTSRDLETDLLALFAQFSTIMRESPLPATLPKLVAECVGNPALSALLVQVNHQRREPLRRVLGQALARGELAADTDVELAIDVIQGAMSIRMHFFLEALSEDWMRALVRLLKHGLGTAARRRR